MIKDEEGFLSDNTVEAHKMAIKALEQEPSGDAISRQAVIDAIYDNKSDFKNDFAQGFFADRIRDLPSVDVPETNVGNMDCISRQAVIDAINTAWTIDDLDNLTSAMLTDMIKALPPVNPKQTEITLESAIDYLHSIGWLQKHDKELTEGVKQEPKTGHWIRTKAYEKWRCSECNTVFRFTFKEHDYCPNCGCRMVEPQEESEVTDADSD